MFCKYCGKRIDDDSTFCSGCGAKLTIAVAPKREKPKQARQKLRDNEPIENFEPTVENLLGQFSPLGRVVFILLCILMVIWVATLTLHIFYPEYINYLNTL